MLRSPRVPSDLLSSAAAGSTVHTRQRLQPTCSHGFCRLVLVRTLTENWASRKLSRCCEHQGTSPSRGHMGSGHCGLNPTSTSWPKLKRCDSRGERQSLILGDRKMVSRHVSLHTSSKLPLGLVPFQSRIQLGDIPHRLFLEGLH